MRTAIACDAKSWDFGVAQNISAVWSGTAGGLPACGTIVGRYARSPTEGCSRAHAGTKTLPRNFAKSA